MIAAGVEGASVPFANPITARNVSVFVQMLKHWLAAKLISSRRCLSSVWAAALAVVLLYFADDHAFCLYLNDLVKINICLVISPA